MDVALGHQPADLVLRHARVLDVFTAVFLPDHDVVVADGRIAYVGPDGGHAIGPGTEVLDLDGQVLLPGFIEGHTHLFAAPYRLEEFVRHALPRGVTAVVTELTGLGALGFDAIRAAVEALADQPIKLFATLPPMVALTESVEAAAPTLEQYRRLLTRPQVVGLGELYWGPLVRGHARAAALIEAALAADKTAEGHTAGARGANLQAYACAGLSSCHEPTSVEEGLERLKLGLTFMAREGEIRQDLETLAPIWAEPRDLRRMALVSDGIGAADLLERGYLERNVQKAIDLGLEPTRAVQLVTLNVAEHFKLDADLGAIAPGRCADLMLVPDEQTIEPLLVWNDGRLVARAGQPLVEPRPVSWPKRLSVSIRRPRLTRPSDFRIAVAAGPIVRARAIELVSGLVTREVELELAVQDGELRADPGADLLKVAAFERASREGAHFVGLLKGFGLRKGALASSMTWDSRAFVAIGADDRDLALAACRLYDIQGGAVLCADGELLAELETPLGGFQSQASLEVVAASLRQINELLRDLGSPWPDPLLTSRTLTTAAIPFFRITEQGYARLRTGEAVGLTV